MVNLFYLLATSTKDQVAFCGYASYAKYCLYHSLQYTDILLIARQYAAKFENPR